MTHPTSCVWWRFHRPLSFLLFGARNHPSGLPMNRFRKPLNINETQKRTSNVEHRTSNIERPTSRSVRSTFGVRRWMSEVLPGSWSLGSSNRNRWLPQTPVAADVSPRHLAPPKTGMSAVSRRRLRGFRDAGHGWLETTATALALSAHAEKRTFPVVSAGVRERTDVGLRV